MGERPVDLLRAGRAFPHGTRARYVAAGCRCDACRAANTAYAAARAAQQKALAGEKSARTIGPLPRVKRMRGGKTVEVLYRQACPGPGGGVWCVGNHGEGSYLRKDSTGGVCAACRAVLAYNGDVDATAARRHLQKLSRQGVGYKAVADASDVSRTVIAQILSGKKKAIQKRTQDRILAVTRHAAADHAVIAAEGTWRLIHEIRERGRLTKAAIARRLGMKRAALQIGRTNVLARTALKVQRLHAQVIRQAEVDDRIAAYRRMEEAA